MQRCTRCATVAFPFRLLCLTAMVTNSRTSWHGRHRRRMDRPTHRTTYSLRLRPLRPRPHRRRGRPRSAHHTGNDDRADLDTSDSAGQPDRVRTDTPRPGETMTVELAARERASAPLRGLPITECTLPALLNRQADAFGSKTLLEIDGSSYTYIQVRDRAAMTAAVFEQAGIRSGDRVATLTGNRLELLETILGATWMGAVAVPLNAELRGEQLLHALANSGARILVIEPALLERLQEITLPSTLERVCPWAALPPSRFLRYVSSDSPHSRVRDRPRLLLRETPQHCSIPRAPPVCPRECVALMPSSTGGASMSVSSSVSPRRMSFTPVCRCSTPMPSIRSSRLWSRVPLSLSAGDFPPVDSGKRSPNRVLRSPICSVR